MNKNICSTKLVNGVIVITKYPNSLGNVEDNEYRRSSEDEQRKYTYQPIVALALGAFASCLNVSYERPALNDSRKRRGKRHGSFKISWKGKVSMGIIITTLLMAGTGVYRA